MGGIEVVSQPCTHKHTQTHTHARPRARPREANERTTTHLPLADLFSALCRYSDGASPSVAQAAIAAASAAGQPWSYSLTNTCRSCLKSSHVLQGPATSAYASPSPLFCTRSGGRLGLCAHRALPPSSSTRPRSHVANSANKCTTGGGYRVRRRGISSRGRIPRYSFYFSFPFSSSRPLS